MFELFLCHNCAGITNQCNSVVENHCSLVEITELHISYLTLVTRLSTGRAL